MRLLRIALLAAAVVIALAAWPQRPAAPPPVDHSQHQVLNTPADRPVPSVLLHLYADAADGYNLFLETRNYRFTPENAGDVPFANEGHAHLYINGRKIARLYSEWRHLPRALFQPGINRLQVELNANDHSIWGAGGEPIGADVLIDTADEHGDPVVREQVRYTLDWDWGRAKRHPAGGWTTGSDLGYTVHVTSGRLVTRNLELMTCHVMPPMAKLRSWFAPAVAFAGHGSLLPNESKIAHSYEEDLANPAALFLESRTVTDPEYCQAHYLIARATGAAPGSPALEVAGTWSRSGAAETPFAIRFSAAYGEIEDLQQTGDGKPAPRSIVGGIDLTLVRRLDSLFDGIDFADGNPSAFGSQVARSAVKSLRLLIQAPGGVNQPEAGRANLREPWRLES